MWTTSTHHPLLTQLVASAGRRAPEADWLPPAPRYQPHRAQAHSHLGAELQTDALVGLNADDQEILRQPVDRRVAKHGERSLLELDRHFSSLRLERLSSAEIERNTRPTPIVDHELERDVGFGCAVWGHIGRSTIILDFVVPDPRRHVLRAHRVSKRDGGSMATSENSWNRWFGTMSRKAPVAS